MSRCITAFLTLVLSSSAFAVPVTWDFTGSVIITVNGGSYWTDAGVSIGDRVTGSVTFDPDAAFAAAVTVPDGTGGTFIFTPNGASSPAFADFSPVVISRTGGAGDLIYDPAYSNGLYSERTWLNSKALPVFGSDPIDTTALYAVDRAAGAGPLDRFEIFRLADQANGGVIPSDSFLSTPPPLADLLFAILSIGEYDKTHTSSTLTVQLDSIHRVPEPETLSLLGAGLAGLGFMRRRRAS